MPIKSNFLNFADKGLQIAGNVNTVWNILTDNVGRERTWQFKFRFSGGKAIHCSFNEKGHICRATLTPEGYMLKGEKVKNDPEDRAVTVGQVQQKFAPGKWHTMQIEVAGNEFVAQVDDGPIAFGADQKIGRPKTNFGFPMSGTYSEIDDIKI